MKVKKLFKDNFQLLFILPFAVLLVVSFFSGSTGIERASTEYEGYIEGCYYLVNHSEFIQVSAQVYYLVFALQILSVVGIITFIIWIIFEINKRK